jgi:hypothetical protein
MAFPKKNYSGVADLSALPPGEYDGFNFSMPEPAEVGGKKVGQLFRKDGTGYLFRNCNFVNRAPPPGCKLEGVVNTTLVERNVVLDEDNIYIDGIKQATVKHYVDRIYGRYVDGKPVYLPIPKDVPSDGPEILE